MNFVIREDDGFRTPSRQPHLSMHRCYTKTLIWWTCFCCLLWKFIWFSVCRDRIRGIIAYMFRDRLRFTHSTPQTTTRISSPVDSRVFCGFYLFSKWLDFGWKPPDNNNDGLSDRKFHITDDKWDASCKVIKKNIANSINCFYDAVQSLRYITYMHYDNEKRVTLFKI